MKLKVYETENEALNKLLREKFKEI